jgi:Na+-translocating ferredoxin:NAD+ oxidoreductase RnfD subunit
MLGAAFQIFAFSMLTDPKTTPETRRMRIVFGLAVAVLDGVLRLMNIQNSPFIALLCISATVPLIRVLAPIVASWVVKWASEGKSGAGVGDSQGVVE